MIEHEYKNKAFIDISISNESEIMHKSISIHTKVNCKSPKMLEDLENYIMSAIQAYEDEYPDVNDQPINLS